jgi:hypothetical protein
MEFKTLKMAVAKQFATMGKTALFRTDVDGDKMWETYLASFPAGSDPIYKTRSEHDCTCCKQFIRAVGNVVSVVDGKVVSIWDVDAGNENYQAVSDALAKLVKSKSIKSPFLHFEKTAGTDRNFQDVLGNVKAWDHFFVNIPKEFVEKSDMIATKIGESVALHDVLLRSLEEIDMDSIDTVLDLISQNSLYRGEEQKFAVSEFKKLKKEFIKLSKEKKDIFVWDKIKVSPVSVSKMRNTVIGTLLTDLSSGVELDSAVASFEAKVAPANYKRPTALVSKAMIEKAKKALEQLGLVSALERRYATMADITVNNILFANRDAKKKMNADVFDDLVSKVSVKKSSLDKVEEVSIEKFISDILPRAESIEIMIENQHMNNLVSLIAPVDPTALNMFKWDNKFSWSYNGEMADSIKERVKKAGGSVEGDLCCRLAWEYKDDLDFRMREPNGHIIYFGNRRQTSNNGGMLDLDANGADGQRDDPAENIFYKSSARMQEGTYILKVNNYSRRSEGKGFTVEVEFGGEVHTFNYEKILRTSETVVVAKIEYSKKNGFKVIPVVESTQSVKDVWAKSTQTFQKVSVMMMSPNYWDDMKVGNKHYFFMIDGCLNDGKARGFFNEFLKEELNPHRKVIEVVGAKMLTDESNNQLSGLGFSSTQRNSVLCKVSGAMSRIVKIVF